jgi:hypothetical protein
VNVPFSLRLILDLAAVSLLLVALAYGWLGNLAHEIIGTAMFGLLISHNIFNRRWYGTIPRQTRAHRILITQVINLSLLVTMLTLLVTSILISRDVFAFLPLTSTFTARQIHTLGSYLALIIAGAHLGLHWTMLMGFLRGRMGIRIEQTWLMMTARGLAAGLAAYGVYSLFALNLGTKLMMQQTMEFWDFEAETLAFFGHLAGVVALCAVVANYVWKLAGKREVAALTARRKTGPT